jgi:hypothetical protein
MGLPGLSAIRSLNPDRAVPAQSEGAYRALPPGLDLDGVLCARYPRKVARDNTVQISWRTLQLLPTRQRPSYAGATVEIQERLDDTLVVWYQGALIATREGPSRLTALRAASPSHNHLAGLERLSSEHVAVSNGSPASESTRRRPPTARQRALWEAVQQVKSQGLSRRAIAKRLGISRSTASKYLGAAEPPTNKPFPKRRNNAERERLLTFSLNSSP